VNFGRDMAVVMARANLFVNGLCGGGETTAEKKLRSFNLLSGQPDTGFPSFLGNLNHMRIIRLTIISAFACAALGVISSNTASAQAYKVEASKPDFEDLLSPEFNGGNQKAFKPKEWLEIEASFKVLMKPEPPSKTAETILVKWYVAVQHPEKNGSYLLLTKDVTHVNVPLNEEIFSSVYLSPASVMRLTGSDRANKNAIELVGYEVLVNGEKIAQETNKNKIGWWNAASEKISRSDTVPLLNKMETPFANHWWDRYAEILPEKR